MAMCNFRNLDPAINLPHCLLSYQGENKTNTHTPYPPPPHTHKTTTTKTTTMGETGLKSHLHCKPSCENRIIEINSKLCGTTFWECHELAMNRSKSPNCNANSYLLTLSSTKAI